MNPGPAPQPPTSKPRLNLIPNSNLPGSMANMAMSPIRSTASSTYSGSTISLPISRQQSSNADGQGGVAIKKEGWASVKENKNFIQPWKQKFLILRKESLDFHKAEGGKISYTLFLKDVVNVGRAEAAGIIFEVKRKSDGSSNSPGDDDGQTRTLQIKVKTDDELYEWIDMIYGACPSMGGVSNPTNFSHAIHVGFDSQTGQFVGLPPEWSKLLNSSAITKEDYERNPQAVFEVLDFYTDLAKRAENPNQYPSLTPTPPPANQIHKQLGHTGAGVAPPRPPHPSQIPRSNYNGLSPQTGGQRHMAQPNDGRSQGQQQQPVSPGYMSQDAMREEQRRKQREADERRELDEYNASLPKTKLPLGQQELGGFGPLSNSNQSLSSQSSSNQMPSSGGQPDRFNPTRTAPSAPKPQQSAPLRAQRAAPAPPGSGGGAGGSSRPPVNPQQSSSSSRDHPGQVPRTPRTDVHGAPSSTTQRYQNGGAASQPRQQQPQGQSHGAAARGPAPVKPLNVGPKAGQQQPSAGVKAAEAALTAKPPASERKQDVRMSTMTENEVMAKLKEAVSKDDPNLSYSKQKKIGQGASGSVYVAKIKETAQGIAREVLRQQGPRAQVAIKQMDLAHQPRKELIVNEIMVMKDSRHKNIVNFLDAFLKNNNSELWVVMEYMEGGALTDVIDNNPSISEEQIATICHEVSKNSKQKKKQRSDDDNNKH